MTASPFCDPVAWAAETFGTADLGDRRRTARAVQMAATMAAAPAASIPCQSGSWAATMGAYRLLDNPAVSYQALLQPTWQQARTVAGEHPIVLLVGDTTEMDYTHHPTTEGLAEIGDGRGRGYLLQSTLAVLPDTRQVLGLLHTEAALRVPAPDKETTAQMLKRDRESELWRRSVEAIGPAPTEAGWVYVSDRYSDIYPYLVACLEHDCGFLVRACRNRRFDSPDPQITLLLDYARTLAPHDERTLHLRASRGKPARDAHLSLAVTPVTLWPPVHDPDHPDLAVWLIRVWEPNPPEGVEGIDWILTTSIPTETVEEAWDRVAWYSCRWVIEDYHQCLKTGCAIEQRNLDDKDKLWRLLGLCAPIAVRLLQLRDLARSEPEQPASAVLPTDVVQVVAAARQLSPADCTLERITREIARFGGYLGRKRDGPPGWKTLWHGWQHVQLLVAGVRLAQHLPPSGSV